MARGASKEFLRKLRQKHKLGEFRTGKRRSRVTKRKRSYVPKTKSKRRTGRSGAKKLGFGFGF